MSSHRVAGLIAGLGLIGSWLSVPAVSSATTPVECHGRPATIVGTPDLDHLTGTPGPDVIAGLGGNDRIRGLAGNDLICGGSGRDHIHAGPGDDLVFGGTWLDFEHGGAGTDRLSGGPGGDELIDRKGGGVYLGQRGNDGIRGAGPALARGGRGFDALRFHRCGCTLLGGPDNDSVNAVAGPTPAHLRGGSGNDDVGIESAVRRAQDVRGGPGHDLLLLVPRLAPGRHTPYPRITIDLAAGVVRTGAARMPVHSFGDAEVDDLTFPHQAHVARAYTLIGNAQDNRLSVLFSGGVVPPLELFGRGGDDELTGNNGPDLLDGGPGHDTGNAGTGVDRCVSIEVRGGCETVRP